VTEATILICDDEPALRELMRVALEGHHRFAEAEDAAEGLRLTRELRPDVLLLDVMLPGGSGLELLETIRADPELSSTRILVVSAWASAQDRQRAEEAGADDFLSKPFAPEQLVAVVDRLLEDAA
jgi:CheY-like chemotaxis protein